ncbi:hypothetical protein [Chimaeribacter arupi]|uniref:hypothetical protein n=1 Tax=Chimaeribacter arupi TaxID=2060066 RepID=UPI0011AF8D79|nr:hypothetical protein [Chimaeribacter arupi]
MDYSAYPWPDDFNLDYVPPSDAIDAAGDAYRLVKAKAPCADDFVGHNKEPFCKKKACDPADFGTSMYREHQKIKDLQRMFKALRRKFIAYGSLEPLHGQMQPEPDENSHFETWLRLNTGIENNFKVLE